MGRPMRPRPMKPTVDPESGDILLVGEFHPARTGERWDVQRWGRVPRSGNQMKV